jgi:predicted transcriptional regulator
MTNLERLRREAGLTQDALATKSGVSRPVIVRIEGGDIDGTTVRTLKRIADALNVTVRELF